MFSANQYRAEAAKYAEFAGQANTPNEAREFKDLQRTFTVLADNEQWVADNHHPRLAVCFDETVYVLERSAASKATALIDVPLAPLAVERNQTSANQQEAKTLVPSGKQFLPRRASESRFAPPQYFYSASRGGVVRATPDQA
jgi:hypothetical protein